MSQLKTPHPTSSSSRFVHMPMLCANCPSFTHPVLLTSACGHLFLKEPKLAVVFSIDGMTTSELSQQIRAGEMGSLVEAATSAESQLTIPNTYGSTDGVATFVESLPRLLGVTDKATVYVTSEDSITEDLASDLNVQVISEDTSLERVIAVDENTALLYVALGDDVDSSLTKILEQVDEATDGDYVAFAVPSSYEHSRVVAARKLQSTSGVTGTNAVRCTPQIILGLLVSVFLLFMLHVGFSSMMDIRPNDKHWLDENVPVGNKVEM